MFMVKNKDSTVLESSLFWCLHCYLRTYLTRESIDAIADLKYVFFPVQLLFIINLD